MGGHFPCSPAPFPLLPHSDLVQRNNASVMWKSEYLHNLPFVQFHQQYLGTVCKARLLGLTPYIHPKHQFCSKPQHLEHCVLLEDEEDEKVLYSNIILYYEHQLVTTTMFVQGTVVVISTDNPPSKKILLLGLLRATSQPSSCTCAKIYKYPSAKKGTCLPYQFLQFFHNRIKHFI